MSIFRNHTPKRQPIIKAVNSHTDHREELKIDYQNRCGYCNDIDTWRFAWFEIDHFVPKKYLIAIKDTDYSNLVYACRSCNNAKRAQWPTADERVCNKNDVGFIDPCDDDYNNQFSRLTNGRIKPETKLGEWMYNAMKFYKPQHEIIWNIEELDGLIDECKSILSSMNDEIITKVLKDRLLMLHEAYRNYTKQLGSIA